MQPDTTLVAASEDTVIGWLCVRPRETEDWQHQCTVLDCNTGTLTFRSSPPDVEGSRVERVVQLGPGTACFPAAEICPGLYTFALRPQSGAGCLLLGVPSLADARRWLLHMQELCAAADGADGEASPCSPASFRRCVAMILARLPAA